MGPVSEYQSWPGLALIMRVEAERRNIECSILLTAIVLTLFTKKPVFKLEYRVASEVSILLRYLMPPFLFSFGEIQSHH